MIVRGDVYQRMINHLANNFTYAQIFPVMKDLEENVFQVENTVVDPYDPKLAQVQPIDLFANIQGANEAAEIDQRLREQSESEGELIEIELD